MQLLFINCWCYLINTSFTCRFRLVYIILTISSFNVAICLCHSIIYVRISRCNFFSSNVLRLSDCCFTFIRFRSNCFFRIIFSCCCWLNRFNFSNFCIFSRFNFRICMCCIYCCISSRFSVWTCCFAAAFLLLLNRY